MVVTRCLVRVLVVEIGREASGESVLAPVGNTGSHAASVVIGIARTVDTD
jgi:hypothetical protein